MDIDYKKLCLELFGTTEVKELEEISKKVNKKNSRGAGRKGIFTSKDIIEMRKMEQKGFTRCEIAEYFNTTRQTISKYLVDDFHDDYTMRMDYMYENKVCTTILVDFLNEKIEVHNKTNDMFHRAFGFVENPTWKNFIDFVEDRCFPRTRGDIKEILNSLGLDSYDSLQILEKTRGRTYDDKMWIKFKYREC